MYEYYNPPIINIDKKEYEFMLCHSFFNIVNFLNFDILTFEVDIELTDVICEFGEELLDLTTEIALNMLSIERALCLWTETDILYWGVVYDFNGLARSRFIMPDFLSRFQYKTELLNTKIEKRVQEYTGSQYAFHKK
jgi:hypothetical protein